MEAIADAIVAIIDAMRFIFGKLIEAIALLFRFMFSRSYRLHKYQEWEKSAIRRVVDIFSVIATVALIAIGSFWIWQLSTPSTEKERVGHGPAHGPRLEITSNTSADAQKVSIRLDGDDIVKFATTEVAKTAFSNLVHVWKDRNVKTTKGMEPASESLPAK